MQAEMYNYYNLISWCACDTEIVTSREQADYEENGVIHSSNRVRKVRGRILMRARTLAPSVNA